jgi:hypothetical protein
MREIAFIADRFSDLIREIPVSSYSGFLEETRRRIKHISEQQDFHIDVFACNNASSESKNAVRTLQDAAQGTDFRVSLKTEQNFSVRIFENIFPGIGFVMLDEEMLQCNTLREHFRKSDSSYKVMFIVNLLGADDSKLRDFSRSFSHRTKTFTITPADLAGKNLKEILSAYIPEQTTLDKINRLAYLNSIKPAFSFLDEILSAENKAANTRKLLNTQNTNITRREEQSLNNNEFTSNIRQLIQKSASELEKSYKVKYEDLNKPNTGKFSTIAAERCNLLTDFERKSLAEKSEKYETTIAQSFLDDFTKAISSAIQKELGKDEAFIKSSYEELITQINIQLKSKGIQPLKAEAIYPPFPDKQRTIQSFCYMNKTYAGEVIKKGPMEYFVALRDYTGLIMVVGGLLAPLSIVASASDSGVFKNIANWVKGTTAGISLLMIVYGIYDLRRRIPKKRVEEFERELGKAKDILQQESKRMFNDSSRDWTGNISNWMRDTTQNINQQIERNMKDQQTQKSSQMNQEKVQQQKQQQSVELLLRGIQSAERVKDQMVTRYRDMVSEVEKDLKL